MNKINKNIAYCLKLPKKVNQQLIKGKMIISRSNVNGRT